MIDEDLDQLVVIVSCSEMKSSPAAFIDCVDGNFISVEE